MDEKVLQLAGLILAGVLPAKIRGSMPNKELRDEELDQLSMLSLRAARSLVKVSQDPEVSKNPDENWRRDEVQFPRLIAELNAIGFTEEQWEKLKESMDLASGDIDEILERATTMWDRIKEGSA